MTPASVRPDWYEIRRRLLHNCYIGFDAFDAMTLPEIEMALDDDFETPRAPPGGQSLAMPVATARYIRHIQTRTPMQYLEEAQQEP